MMRGGSARGLVPPAVFKTVVPGRKRLGGWVRFPCASATRPAGPIPPYSCRGHVRRCLDPAGAAGRHPGLLPVRGPAGRGHRHVPAGRAAGHRPGADRRGDRRALQQGRGDHRRPVRAQPCVGPDRLSRDRRRPDQPPVRSPSVGRGRGHARPGRPHVGLSEQHGGRGDDPAARRRSVPPVPALAEPGADAAVVRRHLRRHADADRHLDQPAGQRPVAEDVGRAPDRHVRAARPSAWCSSPWRTGLRAGGGAPGAAGAGGDRGPDPQVRDRPLPDRSFGCRPARSWWARPCATSTSTGATTSLPWRCCAGTSGTRRRLRTLRTRAGRRDDRPRGDAGPDPGAGRATPGAAHRRQAERRGAHRRGAGGGRGAGQPEQLAHRPDAQGGRLPPPLRRLRPGDPPRGGDPPRAPRADPPGVLGHAADRHLGGAARGAPPAART